MKIPPQFLARFPNLERSPILYLSGSVVEGTEHALSDIDLYCICDDPGEVVGPDGWNLSTSYNADQIPILIEWFEGKRWDLEVWPQSAVEFIIDKLQSDHDSRKKSLSHGDVEFLCRIVNGRPVGSEEEFLTLRDSVHSAGFKRVLMRRFAYSAEVRLEDAAGLLKSGYFKEAAIQIRESFGFVVDIELARGDDFSLSTKRRLFRLERLEKSSFTIEEYWNAEALIYEGSIEDWCHQTIQRLRMILANVD